jgi:nanoRNase/pAp phosphatase (c-di-AMP/oligoRNAs hydrolase)
VALPDVKERVALFFAQHALFREQIARVAEVQGKLVVLDLRDEAVIYADNRFVGYAMYPQCDISMHVMWGREKLNTVYTVGKSVFDRGNRLSVGELMLQHGGGGHHAAGTCQGANDSAEALMAQLTAQILAGIDADHPSAKVLTLASCSGHGANAPSISRRTHLRRSTAAAFRVRS